MSLAPEDLLTIKGVAQLVKVHQKTIRRWCDRGRFPGPIDANGEHRWLRSEVDLWLARKVLRRDAKAKRKAKENGGPEGTSVDPGVQEGILGNFSGPFGTSAQPDDKPVEKKKKRGRNGKADAQVRPFLPDDQPEQQSQA